MLSKGSSLAMRACLAYPRLAGRGWGGSRSHLLAALSQIITVWHWPVPRHGFLCNLAPSCNIVRGLDQALQNDQNIYVIMENSFFFVGRYPGLGIWPDLQSCQIEKSARM